jgi:hypothetical protein
MGPGMIGDVMPRIGTRRDIECVQEEIDQRIRETKIERTFGDF